MNTVTSEFCSLSNLIYGKLLNTYYILYCLCGIYEYLVSIFNNIILNMEKGTLWAVVAFMVMGIVLSFTSMGIFLTKYDSDKEALIKKKSTLTE